MRKQPVRAAGGRAREKTGAGARSGAPSASPESHAEALKLYVVLTRAAAAVGAHTRADIARHGLTPGEFAVLDVLYHKGQLLLHEIQSKVLVSSGGMTYLVDRLEKRGLAQRLECPTDRRAVYAVLTEEGVELMDEIFPAHAACIARAVAGLDAAERRRAAELLRRLGRYAEELDACGGEQE